MINLNEIMVPVQREVPYTHLTIQEKIEVVKTARDHDLLYALATDKSCKVRQALVVREAPIPVEILGDIALTDYVEYIRLMAVEKLMSRINLNLRAKKKLSKILCFICTFFYPEFIRALDTIEGKRQALSAVYLYVIKFGYTFFKDNLFYSDFYNSSSKPYEPYYEQINAYNEHEPWGWNLWDSLERLAVYQYLPAEMNEVLKSGILTEQEIENINFLKNELGVSNFPAKEDRKIVVLADTLYNLGATALDSKDEVNYLCEKQASSTNDSLEDIINAMNLLRKVYKTSIIYTSFNDVDLHD